MDPKPSIAAAAEKEIAEAGSPYLTYGQAAAFLNIKEATLRVYVFRGQIPFLRPSSRVVRFFKPDLIAWLTASRNVAASATRTAPVAA